MLFRSVDVRNLEISLLENLLRQGEVREVVLALGSTMEAEATSSYVHALLSRDFPGISVTRLAQGIPLGTEIKYVDRETLRQSLKYRQTL